MKLQPFNDRAELLQVTLYVRVWIEITRALCACAIAAVTLYVRVWIEICRRAGACLARCVTLYVRVWIEIVICYRSPMTVYRHPLREGVD